MFDFLQGRLLPVRLTLLVAVLALVAIGILTIYSLGHPAETAPGQSNKFADQWKKQAQYAIVGFGAFLALNWVNYRRLGAVSGWLYAATLLLLTILLLDKYIDLPFVPVVNNSRRWLRIGLAGRFVQLQPSEICKLTYVIALAWYLRYRSNYRNLSSLLGPFLLTVLPMILILKEPDLGTVLLIMPVLFMMLFVAGAKGKHLLMVMLLALCVSPLLWNKMDKYQRLRISSVALQSKWLQDKAQHHPWLGKILVGTTFSTQKWESNWGYHLIRSKYAVASGGLTGYGFSKGPFVKNNFLPERHNDFIFAVIAHQWGFVGCMVILGLYVIITICILEIAASNSDPFAKLLAVGIAATFAVEVLVNIGMTLGLMPITGLTLPFVSHGGSSLVVSLASVGLLNNLGRSWPFTVAPKT
jgi:cell division protein FtsW (lipid II flippase)